MLGFLWVLFRFIRTIVRSLGDPEFRALFALVLIMLAVGSIFYSNVEGWSLFNSLYFSVITLATIGYGDYSPHTVAGKAFTIVYIIVGIGILLGFVDAVALRSRADSSRLQRRMLTRPGMHAGASVERPEDERPTTGDNSDG